jgi:hypothetical protein
MDSVSVRQPEGKIPFGRQRNTWEGNNKMHISETMYVNVDSIFLAQGRDHWPDPVTVISFGTHKIWGILLPAQDCTPGVNFESNAS